jgi:2-methylisocitrate lyase-like PEP mutase family enzyme
VLFAEAGADVVFPVGLATVADAATLVAQVRCPVNALAGPNLPIAGLAAAGVRRISVGGNLFRFVYGSLAAAVREMLESGTLPLGDVTSRVAHFNNLFLGRAESRAAARAASVAGCTGHGG